MTTASPPSSFTKQCLSNNIVSRRLNAAVAGDHTAKRLHRSHNVPRAVMGRVTDENDYRECFVADWRRFQAPNGGRNVMLYAIVSQMFDQRVSTGECVYKFSQQADHISVASIVLDKI